MVLTNAQRQARFRTRLKERAGSPSEMMRAACLSWLKELREEVIRDEAEPASELARIDTLRNEIEDASDLDQTSRSLLVATWKTVFDASDDGEARAGIAIRRVSP